MQVINRDTVLVPIEDVQPHPANVNQGDVGAIYESIGHNGFYGSIVAQQSSGRILRGNHTWQAARQMGAQEIPVTFVDVDDETALRILLVDNRVTRLGSDDPERLARLLQELAATPAALQGTGFDGDALDELLADLGQGQPPMQGDPDAVPEVPAEPISRRGDLWVLGEHRVLCGESTADRVLERLRAERMVDAVVTDPPYAFGLASTSALDSKSGGWHDMMNNASWFADRFSQWSRIMPRGPAWVCCNWRTLPIMMRAAFDAGVGIDSVLVWYKDWIGPGGSKGLRPTYEMVTLTTYGDYAVPDRGVEDFFKAEWSSHKPHGHGAEKPVALMAHLLAVSACSCVFDPFLGAGTTLAAAEQTGRTCYGVEVEPRWCDVAVRRWETLTGQTAVREQVTDDARVLTRA